MSRTLMITGTDTGAGKTTVTAALARGLGHAHRQINRQDNRQDNRQNNCQNRVACFKPVASGCRTTQAGLRSDDALELIRAANVVLPYSTVNPIALQPAIAPHLAAARAGVNIDPIALAAGIGAIDADYRLVEGAGGWMVPLGQRSMTVDLARACRAQVLLVVGIKLGCINHALLSARAIVSDDMTLVGWIGNMAQADIPDVADIIATISSILGPPLGVCRFQPTLADACELAAGLEAALTSGKTT